MALIAGAFLGASAGVLCLFAMSSPKAPAPRPAAAVAASTSKKAATPAAPGHVASADKGAKGAAAKGASPAGNTGATNRAQVAAHHETNPGAAKPSFRDTAPGGLVALTGPAATPKSSGARAAARPADAAAS
ncbi:MAG TPA: hypothetical protein VHF22_00630, partial [Planctomycetota bacterium]|nr:hypothetical protein [Planctomycetota bacterium]